MKNWRKGIAVAMVSLSLVGSMGANVAHANGAKFWEGVAEAALGHAIANALTPHAHSHTEEVQKDTTAQSGMDAAKEWDRQHGLKNEDQQSAQVNARGMKKIGQEGDSVIAYDTKSVQTLEGEGRYSVRVAFYGEDTVQFEDLIVNTVENKIKITAIEDEQGYETCNKVLNVNDESPSWERAIIDEVQGNF